jgi:hypothetical protein
MKDPGRFIVSSRYKTVSAAFCFVGLLAFVLTLINNPQRAWMAYLVPLFYFTSLALGGLFFSSIQHVTKAGWSVNIRRISEALTAFLPSAFVLSLIFLAGAPQLYKWLSPEKVAADPLLQHKAPYLNATFFVIRLVGFFGLWLLFRKWIVGRSVAQDQSGDVNLTHSLVGVSIGFIAVFALSYSFFSVDLLMSLEPHWFSTIFGVYAFAGLFQSTLAFMILTLLYLGKKGLLQGYFTEDHMHDLGKFLFAFTVFWAYIAFSQYMLIWYANLPEETIFIIPRTEHSWLFVSILLLVGKFFVPFFALLPRWAKRTPTHLAAVSVLILVMQYVDLYWLAYPSIYEESAKFSLSEVGVFLGFLGLFLFALGKFLSQNSLVPVKDPRIQESLHHHVVY